MGTMVTSVRWLTFGAVFAGACLSVAAFAQEHPEHPKEKPAAKEALSKEALGTAIRDWVAQDSKLKGGYFLEWDAKAGKALVLTLAKVHDDKLAMVGKDTYFACADFKSSDEAATMYDLDIFMKGDSARTLAVTEVTVHKENGKERYSWKEEGGVWKRVPK